ncbi:MAG: hypothetical protein Q9218_007476 [Villophora microphyllina]
MSRSLPTLNHPDIDDSGPHPNRFDQVEAAIYDALQLVLVTLELIDKDSVVYPHYFARRDKDKVKQVFEAVAGPCGTGNVLLSNIHIQTTDTRPPGCDEWTPAHMNVHDGDSPFIVLCPLHVWKKKAFTILAGAGDPDINPGIWPDEYLRCKEVVGDGRVNWRMETLGAILLHEYLHFNLLVKHVYDKEILDQKLPDGRGAYGPWAVYDNLNQNLLSRVNADSYVYYAMHLFWKEVCGVDFAAPLRDPDEMDVDCGGQPCREP